MMFKGCWLVQEVRWVEYLQRVVTQAIAVVLFLAVADYGVQVWHIYGMLLLQLSN